MGQTASTAVPPSHLVGPLLRYARERGESVELAKFGLTDAAFECDASPIANRALGSLFDDIAELLDEPHLGLVLPARLQFQRYAIPELAARASATLREALQQWARFATLVHPAVAFGFEEAEGLTHFSHRTLGYPRGLSRHLNEFALAAAVYFSRQTSGSGPRVLEVHFVHPRPQSLDRLQTFFRTSALYFGAAENRLVIDSESLAGVQATADARLLATAQALGQSSLTELTPEDSSIRATVAERLQQQLDRGEIRIRKLARELHMSVRSLQRRLAEADTTFALLLDEVRHQLACKLVAETETPLSDVALRVGFAEFATFSRAFKRWTGSSPGAFRAARR